MYMPIVKNRLIEMNVLREIYKIPLSSETIPMIEIIQEHARSNSAKTFIDDLEEILKQTSSFVLVDILKTNIPKSTTETVREFLTKVNRKPGFALDLMLQLKKIHNIVPVVSYHPENIDAAAIKAEVEILRANYSKLALRIKSVTYYAVFPIFSSLVESGDLIILDIDNASHTNPALKVMYKAIREIKNKIGVTTFIVNSTKSETITNKQLEDKQPILEIDNSLKEVYNASSYGFNGFGDYACVANTLPTSGGSISPAGIYYSRENNFFVGFKARKQDLSEFVYIASSIVDSEYWKEYLEEHHKTCPGCKMIYGISEGSENGKNQAKWKGITMSHYIYTIDESL